MFTYDSIANAQAQAGAFPNGFGGVKWIEYTVRFFQPRPGIRKKNNHVAAVAHGPYRQHPAPCAGHGVYSVIDYVEEYLHQLIAVAAHTWQYRLQLLLDARI